MTDVKVGIDYDELATKVSGEKLAGILAVALLNAMQSGGKEAEDSGGWSAFLQNGPAPYVGQKAIAGVTDAVYPHGPGGLFSTLGLERTVINAHMSPEGLDSMLPVFPTRFLNPIYPFLTGWSEDDGDEPDGYCDDCLGGTIQACEQSAQFGHVCRGSDEIRVTQVGDLVNRGETTALQLLGDVLGPSGVVKMPSTPRGWLNVVTRAEMVKVGILLQRWAYQMLWRGNPANSSAGGGYTEFPGLERQVRENIVDLKTGALCDALDSYVVNFGCNAIDATVGGADIVRWISNMEWWIRRNAQRMKLMPVQWVFVMRPDLWFQLSSIWACRYMTDRCTTADGNNAIVINDDASVKLRDNMRQGKYLIVNGRRYPVVEDDGMTEENGDGGSALFNNCLLSGEFLSDIMFLPLSARGMKTIYWEHKDYRPVQGAITDFRARHMWTDGGRQFWTSQELRGCTKVSAEMDLRIILRTPHLAGRIDSVKYSSVRHSRSPFYTDPYFEKGGTSTRTDVSVTTYPSYDAS